jgi:hypothetical protein
MKSISNLIQIIILIMATLFYSRLFGQVDKCATTSYTQYLQSQYPNLLPKVTQLEQLIDQYGTFLQQSDQPLIIPVVVHVIYNNLTQNISDAQINSQIEVLNKDFRKLNSDIVNVPPLFENSVADCFLEFKLATYDPDGFTTNGITRTQTDTIGFSYYDDFMKYTSSGGKDPWDTKRFLNIWVCDLSGGILGYATFPGTSPENLDGVVIDYENFGTIGTAQAPYNLGRTATHEIGHWLNLKHIWGDDQYDTDKCAGDDDVYDTPNQEIMNYNCPTFPSPSCGNESDMFMNYMDYVDDACMYMFTQGQKGRMQSTIFVTRSQLGPSIDVQPNIISGISPSGSNQSFSISNPNLNNSINWTITTRDSWITNITPQNGTNNATVSFSVSDNSNGIDRTGIIEIATNDQYNTVEKVFVFQNGGVITYTVNLQNIDPVYLHQTDTVGIWRDSTWEIRPTGTDFSIGENQLITAKFSSKLTFTGGKKFQTVSDENQIITSYENFSIDLPFGDKYWGLFVQSYDSYIENVFPELEGVSDPINYSGPEIGFKDPWFPDSNHAYGVKNRGLDAIYHYHQSFFDLSKYDNIYDEDYKGIFLNQDPNSQPYFYSLRIPLKQSASINNKQYTFNQLNYVLSGSELRTPTNIHGDYLESPVVFTGPDPYVQNVFKGSQLSNNTEAFTNNSQRKFIRTDNGNLHMVYESMGYVWYERKTINGDWEIANEGKPISNLEAKSPSITNSVNEIAIVYQEKNGNNRKIKLAYFDSWGDLVHDNVVCDESNENYSVDAQPVISWGYNSKIIVLWKSSDTFLQQGLVYKTGSLSYYNLTWKYAYVVKLDDTDATSSNPTVGVRKKQEFPVTFHIAWQNGDTELKYTQIGYINSTTMASSIGTDSPSLGSGYTKNYSPSIVVMDDNLPRLTWIGEKTTPTFEKKVVLRGRSTSSWNSTFFKYGNNANAVSMNFNETGTIGGYAFAWSEGSPSISGHKSVVNTRITWSPVNIQGAEGKYIHLSNGNGIEDMYTIGLDDASLPYEIVLSNHITQDAEEEEEEEYKVSANIINSIGREGLLNYSNNVFSFELFDIIHDSEVIEFEPLTDMTTFNDISSLNGYLESLPFEISDNSSLQYSVRYGIQESLNKELVLGENEFVNYKVQLVDENTDEVLGSYDNITFTQENLEQYNNIDYNILTEGVGTRTVKMRLVVSSNIDADPNLAAIYCDGSLLAKNGATNIKYDGAAEIKTYDLAQNYPNPFNPSTTIKYQIPNAGNVSLKIYDLLGAEVMTLVNTTQAKGRYEVNFDASQLSSGVYIYRIQANDYVASRKMMLLK